jgi:hypothetical protein
MKTKKELIKTPTVIFSLSWVFFIVLISCAEKVNSMYFFYFSSIMIWFTYLINTFKNIYLSLKVNSVLLTMPSFIFWYLFITYNDFLKINSISYEIVFILMSAYFYILIYLFLEATLNLRFRVCNRSANRY